MCRAPVAASPLTLSSELDIETGEVLFEWHSLDHVSPHGEYHPWRSTPSSFLTNSATETKLPLTKGQAGLGYNSSTAWDYFHINSITKDDEGSYLVSARHASTLFKINGTDGSIIWRLGGPYSDFELGPNVTFGFQHHARWLPSDSSSVERISLFDNSVYGSESAGNQLVQIYPFSRGKYIAVDHTRKTATLERVFHPPEDNVLTKSQGSLQTLPNGNVLINWGSEGQVSEYTDDGTLIFHAFLDSGFLGDNVQNYRAFRYNWTGFSPETPAVTAKVGDDGVTRMWASWNGDTTTETWIFSWTETGIRGRTVAKSREVQRTGFETELAIQATGRVLDVRAEAVDARGRRLATSASVAVESALPKGRWQVPVASRRKDAARMQEVLTLGNELR